MTGAAGSPWLFSRRADLLLFGGPAPASGALLHSLLVPLLALPQATHYLLDAWTWKVRTENPAAAKPIGLEAPGAAAGG